MNRRVLRVLSVILLCVSVAALAGCLPLTSRLDQIKRCKNGKIENLVECTAVRPRLDHN
jgi:hypothetical protein